MSRLRLVWKLLAIAVAVTAGTTLIFSLLLSHRLSHVETDLIQQRLRDATLLVRPLARELVRGAANRAELAEQIELAAKKTQLRITVIAGDGTVLLDTDEDAAVMTNHNDRPEVQEAREKGEGLSVRTSPTVGYGTMYVALPVDDNSHGAIVRSGVAMREVRQHLNSIRKLILGTGAIVCLGVFLLIALGIRGITRPLESLTATAEAIAAGDLQRQAQVSSRDEIGTLANAVNSMTRQLAARIDELQTQRQLLEENSQRLETVLGGMIEGVVAVDEEERILFANHAALHMLEISDRGSKQRPIWEAVRQESIQQLIRRTLTGVDEKAVELDLPRQQAVVSVRARRLPGTPCPGVVLVMHDITGLRRLENLRREFVSNVSHELKTPLTSIQAYTETLLEGALHDPAHNRNFLQRIGEQADRLHALILDLLSLARIESGEEVYDLGPIAIGDLIQSCVQERTAIAEAKEVSLQTEGAVEELRIDADEEGLRTILDNLIDNAVKYTPAGGKVTVSWRGDERQVTIEVADTGVGMDRQHLPRIFERFYRVDKARSRELGGTGLGLSIVKHLTQVFGGTVEVQSELGLGSKFTLRFPRI